MGICDVLKKTPYYLAMSRGYIPNDLLLKHNVFFDRIYDKQGGQPKVMEEFYDVVLELASYAKKHLEMARSIFVAEKTSNPSLSPLAHRALLLGQEADYFLELLELHNFNIFEAEFRRNSYYKMPFRLHKAAKAGLF